MDFSLDIIEALCFLVVGGIASQLGRGAYEYFFVSHEEVPMDDLDLLWMNPTTLIWTTVTDTNQEEIGDNDRVVIALPIKRVAPDDEDTTT